MFSLIQYILLVTILVNDLCRGYPNINLRIVNGTDAEEGEFPYTVSLRIWAPGAREIHWCGGSIISTTFILTAGHCLEEQLIFARVGEVYLDDLSLDHSHSMPIRKVYLHPDYREELNSINDVALIELVSPLKFNKTIQPVKLPETNSTIPFNNRAWITGWGMVNESIFEPSDTLQKVRVTLFSDNYCREKLGSDYLVPENVCAGDKTNSKGHCSGDSGGPLVINGIQWGIISWSYKPCISAPGVYARLTNPNYREWIRDIAGV